MKIPYLLEELTYGSQMEFLACVHDNTTDIDNIMKAVIAVVGKNAIDLVFDLPDDLGIIGSDFYLNDTDELSVMRIFHHVFNLIKSYEYDETRFKDDYWFVHHDNKYKIPRNLVENLLSGTVKHRLSFIDTVSIQDFRRRQNDPNKYINNFEIGIMQVAVLAKEDDDITIIDKIERENHYDNRRLEFEDLPASIVQDVSFFFKTISKALNPIPDSSSFLKAYPILEEAVIQQTTIKLLKNEAVQSFNKWVGIQS